jgi:hypothetical protein
LALVAVTTDTLLGVATPTMGAEPPEPLELLEPELPEPDVVDAVVESLPHPDKAVITTIKHNPPRNRIDIFALPARVFGVARRCGRNLRRHRRCSRAQLVIRCTVNGHNGRERSNSEIDHACSVTGAAVLRRVPISPAAEG